MTSKELTKLFESYADAQFRNWSQGEAPGMRSVYACEYGTIWKFTPREGWQFATRVVQNNGGHDFLLSAALRSRPPYIVKGEDNEFCSTDSRVRSAAYAICLPSEDQTGADFGVAPDVMAVPFPLSISNIQPDSIF